MSETLEKNLLESLPDAPSIRARLAELVREEVILKRLLRLVSQRDQLAGEEPPAESREARRPALAPGR